MARSFSFSDAKSLIQVHRNLIAGLERVVVFPEKGKAAVLQTVEKFQNAEVNRILNTIPVEELNQEKSGIRTKLLREHGYITIADLRSASNSAIARIHGFSDDGAVQIKQAVDRLTDRTKNEVKIKLSADDRNPVSSDLVLAIFLYKSCSPYATACKKLLLANRKRVESDIAALAPASNGLKWLFTGKSKKEQAEAGFRRLADTVNGSYGDQARRHLEPFEQLQMAKQEEAWTDFLRDPISFYTVLESLCPGVLGAGDTEFGLPEDLVREISEEPLYLDGLKCILRRYQEWGVKYALHQKKVLLGDEMGLGKTIQAIAAMVSLKNTGKTHFLVICPAGVLTNWCREIQKNSDLPVTKIHGEHKLDALAQWNLSGGVAVTTYETCGNVIPDQSVQISMLVVDEAHYIKNPNAKRTANVRQLCVNAERILFMTGTALENRVDEMISLIRILHADVAETIKNIAFLSSAPQFREKISPVYFRRKRQEVLSELPELIENREWCTLGPEEYAIYRECILLNQFQAARRVSWNISDLNTSSKAKRLLEIIDDATEEHRKIIVFSFFLDTLSKISELLGNRCIGSIAGAVSPKRRQEIIDDFEKSAPGSVLTAQILAGGTGLNIQAASVVVICEPQLKPSIEKQAISRAYRMGQPRNVLVYRLLADETIDERITDLHEEKQQHFNAFADESVLGKESIQIDDTTINMIMEDERERITQQEAAPRM